MTPPGQTGNPKYQITNPKTKVKLQTTINKTTAVSRDFVFVCDFKSCQKACARMLLSSMPENDLSVTKATNIFRRRKRNVLIVSRRNHIQPINLNNSQTCILGKKK